MPTAPLPFPSVLVASRDDPYSNFGEAEDMAFAWGSAIADAGFSGHINVESGHGPVAGRADALCDVFEAAAISGTTTLQSHR